MAKMVELLTVGTLCQWSETSTFGPRILINSLHASETDPTSHLRRIGKPARHDSFLEGHLCILGRTNARHSKELDYSLIKL